MSANQLPCCERCGREELPELLQLYHYEMYCPVCYDDLAEKQAEAADDDHYGGSTPTMSDKEYVK